MSARGGIVLGHSIDAKVGRGEWILTRAQQANLAGQHPDPIPDVEADEDHADEEETDAVVPPDEK